VTARILIAVALIVVAAIVAWVLDRRRRPGAPTQASATIPPQLDRNDFPHPEAPWLVVLWSSRTCESCQGLFEKIAPLASDDVGVVEVEYQTDPDLHRRYKVDAAPMTIVVDRDGVTRASFVGSFAAPELWASIAELRGT
jgi:Thioredoxin